MPVNRAILLPLLLTLAPLLCHASDKGSVLDEINLARTCPRQYAAIVHERMSALPGADQRCIDETAAFLLRQPPLEPLQSVPGLIASARLHVADQSLTGAIGHRGADGGSPWSRMAQTGQRIGRAGENISYGYSDPRTIVVTLIVDQGVPDHGHRRNIFSRDFKVAGSASGSHARYGAMCVIDFAGGFLPKGEKLAMTDAWRGSTVW